MIPREHAEAIAALHLRELESRAEMRRAVRIAAAAMMLIAAGGGALAWWVLGRL